MVNDDNTGDLDLINFIWLPRDMRLRFCCKMVFRSTDTSLLCHKPCAQGSVELCYPRSSTGYLLKGTKEKNVGIACQQQFTMRPPAPLICTAMLTRKFESWSKSSILSFLPHPAAPDLSANLHLAGTKVQWPIQEYKAVLTTPYVLAWAHVHVRIYPSPCKLFKAGTIYPVLSPFHLEAKHVPHSSLM